MQLYSIQPRVTTSSVSYRSVTVWWMRPFGRPTCTEIDIECTPLWFWED